MNEQLNTAPCGYLIFSDDGRIVAVNETLAHLLGYETEALVGQPFELILGVGGKIFYHTHLFPVLKLHGGAEEVYLSLRTRAGADISVLANAVRREREGILLNECVFMRILQRSHFEDELVRARKQAEAATETKAKFLSMMSHELRTPLQAITGYSDLLRDGVSGVLNSQQLGDIASIKSASEEMVRLLNDILEFARLESGNAELRLGAVSVRSALKRAELLLVPKFQEAGLVYARLDPEVDIAVQANADRLQQVLLNLMTNAIKFTPRGGRISTDCQVDGAVSLIRVRDTGSGIPSDQLERIFEPFMQLDRHRVGARQRGVGLGLSISRELTRAMGGELHAKSGVGEGSVFTVTLPRAVRPECSAAAAGS